MTIQEMKDLLILIGETEESMDRYWQENLDFGYNQKIVMLNKAGKGWRDLNPKAASDLPGLLEKDKKAKQLKEDAVKLAATEVKPKELTLEQKILSGVHLSESELRDAVNEYEVEEIEGDESRWTRFISTIIQVGENYYRIDWQRGLTEMQENCYDNQPQRVRRWEHEVTQVVVDWIEI